MPGRVGINPHPLPASTTNDPSNHGHPTQNHVEHLLLNEYSMVSPVHLASAAHREYIVLTLDDLFHGKEVHVQYTRWKQHGESEPKGMLISIPPNCPDGAAWLVPEAGHQLSNGKYQDMYFQVEVEQDNRGFRREGNNVRLLVRIPWENALNTRVCSFNVQGPDGTSYAIEVDYCRTRASRGSTEIGGRGLPVYNAGGRGDLIFE
jgi:DnaJ-class molecular chaperone